MQRVIVQTRSINKSTFTKQQIKQRIANFTIPIIDGSSTEPLLANGKFPSADSISARKFSAETEHFSNVKKKVYYCIISLFVYHVTRRNRKHIKNDEYNSFIKDSPWNVRYWLVRILILLSHVYGAFPKFFFFGKLIF